MQRDSIFSNVKVSQADAYEVGVNLHSTSSGDHYQCDAPVFAAGLPRAQNSFHLRPLNEVEFEPTKACPKNFVIFDQTEKKSQVVFHPVLADKFNYHSNFDYYASLAGDEAKGTETNDEDKPVSYSSKEDSEDINALLSSEEDDDEDDVTSSGRTPAYWEGSFFDTSDPAEGMMSTSSRKSLCNGASSSRGGSKRERMRKMVKVLKGIIPGGEVMDTPAVLDETVNYLKSLKVEVKKLGIQNFKD